MKIKPHGAWYFLPIVILFVSIILAIVFFFKAFDNPEAYITDVTLGNQYSQELTEGSFIGIYIEDYDLIDYSFEKDGENIQMEYSTSDGDYTILIEVDKLSGDTNNWGYSITEFDQTNAFESFGLVNVGDIDILSDGEYQITFTSDDTLPNDMGIQFISWGGYLRNVTIMVISLAIGIPAAIISLIVIIVMRHNSKKKVKNRPSSSHIDASFYRDEDVKEKEEIKDQFDY